MRNVTSYTFFLTQLFNKKAEKCLELFSYTELNALKLYFGINLDFK